MAKAIMFVVMVHLVVEIKLFISLSESSLAFNEILAAISENKGEKNRALENTIPPFVGSALVFRRNEFFPINKL